MNREKVYKKVNGKKNMVVRAYTETSTRQSTYSIELLWERR